MEIQFCHSVWRDLIKDTLLIQIEGEYKNSYCKK